MNKRRECFQFSSLFLEWRGGVEYTKQKKKKNAVSKALKHYTWKMLMKGFCRNVTQKRFYYIPVIPLGISYSRLNNFTALHMIATVGLYWASSLQLKEQGVIIVPRACMCSGPAEAPSKENQQSPFFDAFIQVGTVCAALWLFAPGGCAMD